MRCPNCGTEIPAEAGQHATVPTVGVMECPTCGASARAADKEAPGVERASEGGWGEERPDSFAGSETVEGVREELEQKEDS